MKTSPLTFPINKGGEGEGGGGGSALDSFATLSSVVHSLSLCSVAKPTILVKLWMEFKSCCNKCLSYLEINCCSLSEHMFGWPYSKIFNCPEGHCHVKFSTV